MTLYISSALVTSGAIQGLLLHHFKGSPLLLQDQDDDVTFYIPSVQAEPIVLIYQRNLISSREAVDLGISTAMDKETPPWHMHILSYRMGIALIRNPGLFVAIPVQEGGAVQRYRIVLTEATTGPSVTRIEDHAYYYRFKTRPGLIKVDPADIPVWIQPPTCIDPDEIRKVWRTGTFFPPRIAP